MTSLRPAYLRVSFEAKKYQVFGKRKHVTIPLKHFIQLDRYCHHNMGCYDTDSKKN